MSWLNSFVKEYLHQEEKEFQSNIQWQHVKEYMLNDFFLSDSYEYMGLSEPAKMSKYLVFQNHKAFWFFINK